MKPDYTQELARLLTFAADVATAIRMYSKYSGGQAQYQGEYREPSKAPADLMFLSDAINQLLGVGNAVEQGDGQRLIYCCESVIGMFESYLADNPRFDPQAKHTFDFWSGLVDLRKAIEAVKAIHIKAEASLMATA